MIYDQKPFTQDMALRTEAHWIGRKVENVTGVSIDQMKSNSRRQGFVYARCLYYKLLLNKGYSHRKIARTINRSRATLYNYDSIFEQESKYSTTFKELIKRLDFPRTENQ